MSLSFAILVTGPAYGTQSASTAYRFARTLLAQGHTLSHLFFYQDGVCNGNGLHLPASDETESGASVARAGERAGDPYRRLRRRCHATRCAR